MFSNDDFKKKLEKEKGKNKVDTSKIIKKNNNDEERELERERNDRLRKKSTMDIDKMIHDVNNKSLVQSSETTQINNKYAQQLKQQADRNRPQNIIQNRNKGRGR
jgi:hypothetical protein